MSLKDAYQYIYDYELLDNNEDTNFIIYLAAMQAFIEDIPNIKCSLNDIIEKVKEDISCYSENEPVQLYFEEIDNYYIPIDYTLSNHDLLYGKDYIETTLIHTLNIFKIINT